MKGRISDKARRVLNDKKGADELLSLAFTNKDYGEIELSDGTKFDVTFVQGPTIKLDKK